jgi:serine/threonine-protein kinase SRPK3
VQAGDVPSVAAFIRRCLVLDPTLRPSAQELLNDMWLQDL